MHWNFQLEHVYKWQGGGEAGDSGCEELALKLLFLSPFPLAASSVWGVGQSTLREPIFARNRVKSWLPTSTGSHLQIRRKYKASKVISYGPMLADALPSACSLLWLWAAQHGQPPCCLWPHKLFGWACPPYLLQWGGSEVRRSACIYDDLPVSLHSNIPTWNKLYFKCER